MLPHSLIIRTAPKLEALLRAEVEQLGALPSATPHGAVLAQASTEALYALCLWSRLATRVLIQLGSFPASDAKALSAALAQFPFAEHLQAQATFAVRCEGHNEALRHNHYTALLVKDAIVDHFRSRGGPIPTVCTSSPQCTFFARLQHDTLHLSIDAAGFGLHRRGYRQAGGSAPLPEHLAAAINALAHSEDASWVVDPMCGSGTLLIEAALRIADWAPGLLLDNTVSPCPGWIHTDLQLWQSLCAQAEQRKTAGLQRLAATTLWGLDNDALQLRRAEENIQQAGLSPYIRLARCPIDRPPPFASDAPPAGDRRLVLCNPPHGHRLLAQQAVTVLYSTLGRALQTHYAGFAAYILIGDKAHGHGLNLKAEKFWPLQLSKLPATLLQLQPDAPAEPKPGSTVTASNAIPLSPEQTELYNRLRKNHKQRLRFASQAKVRCYRLYDADLPNYAVAIDVYERYLLVSEYAAPRSVPEATAERRLRESLLLAAEVTQTPPERIVVKTRQRQRGAAQYEAAPSDPLHSGFAVREGEYTFWVCLVHGVDSGLFLDHRKLRALIAQRAADKRFLNLFAYTGSATVAAARGGAQSSLSVDLSRTYGAWAERNFTLNGLSDAHQVLQADCLRWLRDAPAHYAGSFDLIYVNPPTFSRSKRMTQTFEVQRDHVELLAATRTLLAPGGEVIFATHAKGFKVAPQLAEQWHLTDLSAQCVDEGFANAKQPLLALSLKRRP